MYGELFKGGTLSVAKLVEERGPPIVYIKKFQHFKDIKINNTENETPISVSEKQGEKFQGLAVNVFCKQIGLRFIMKANQ